MEDAALFLRAQEGDGRAREELFDKNAGLIRHVVKRYLGRGCEAEDLYQLGAIGLVKAIEKFDVEYGVCFSTYAVPLISGEIRRFLRDDGLVKVSRGIKENQWKINRARERLNARLGREATLQELEEESGIGREDIVLALESGREVESIYKTVYHSDGDEIYLLDTLRDGQQAGTSARRAGSDAVLERIMLEQVMSRLDERERQLIRLRYYENQTQTQTAGLLGMSQVQVSRLEKKTLLRMRTYLFSEKRLSFTDNQPI